MSQKQNPLNEDSPFFQDQKKKRVRKKDRTRSANHSTHPTFLPPGSMVVSPK